MIGLNSFEDQYTCASLSISLPKCYGLGLSFAYSLLPHYSCHTPCVIFLPSCSITFCTLPIQAVGYPLLNRPDFVTTSRSIAIGQAPRIASPLCH